MLIVDAHQDIAYNMLTHGRDVTRPVAETRRLEAGIERPARLDDALLGYPEYRQGRVGVVFASLFAAPIRAAVPGESLLYSSAYEAHRLYNTQIDSYERLTDEHPDKFRLMYTRPELEAIVAEWLKLLAVETEPAAPEDPEEAERKRRQKAERRNGQGSEADQEEAAETQMPPGPPVGLAMMMEGAEGIREPAEVEAWWERGVRIIGPAWRSTPYSGGTQEPGPLTSAGFELLERMASLNAGLDLTHMDETAVLQALDVYPGPLLASHSNAHALLKGSLTNRHLSDRVIQGIIERGGVIGIVPYLGFLKPGWKLGDRREAGSLNLVAAHIDYVCQIAGDAHHVGLGTDFDGGFGLQSVPPGFDSIADLHKLTPLLVERGYTDEDIAAIFGENWLALLRRILPETI